MCTLIIFQLTFSAGMGIGESAWGVQMAGGQGGRRRPPCGVEGQGPLWGSGGKAP